MGIESRLTMIAWEAMHLWSADGLFEQHVFAKNNPLAGYASVLHALELVGLTGHYDVVVNCVLQDTDAPLTFLTEEDLPAFRPAA